MYPTAETIVTISTAKGGFEATIREVCEWQAEMQGACATVTVDGLSVSVDGVYFDAEDLDDAVEDVLCLLCLLLGKRAEQRADAFRDALGDAVDSGVYFEVKTDDGRVVVALGDREDRGYEAWQDVNAAVVQTAKAVGLEFWDSGPATPCDEEGRLLGGEYHVYDVRA